MKRNAGYNLLVIFFMIAMCHRFYSLTTLEVKADNIKHIDILNDSIIENKLIETAKIDINNRSILKVKNKKYTLSKIGKDFIKSNETCVLNAYNDPDPKRRSVGWGHQIRPGENLEHITQKKADELFEQDIEWVNDAINRLIAKNDNRFTYSQGFIDGLGSLIYNCGERGVTLTEFWNRWQKCRYNSKIGNINENDLTYTISAVKTSRISAPGHIQRRYREHLMMLN